MKEVEHLSQPYKIQEGTTDFACTHRETEGMSVVRTLRRVLREEHGPVGDHRVLQHLLARPPAQQNQSCAECTGSKMMSNKTETAKGGPASCCSAS